jgi:lipid II:glycine glycyltransferase (peptidoglycan interpeptide bridge formation enzyme)
MRFIQQTENWAKFRKEVKNEEYRKIEVKHDDEMKLHGYLQKMSLPLGKSWLYCNRGPVINHLTEGFLTEFLEKIKEFAKDENLIFLRIEPPIVADTKIAKVYLDIIEDIGFIDAHDSHQPEYTLIIDLEPDEEDILGQMKQKGRYNIRLAEKKGVKVKESDDVESFYKILEETVERDKFAGHDKKYYQKMLEILGREEMAKLYLAEHEGDILGGIIVTFYKETATYYYGASSNHKRNLMAPYLLQWHAIKEAKLRGCKYYDMLGIAPPGAKNHPWSGVTQFKTRFGGETVKYVKAKEYVFKPVLYGGLLSAKMVIKRQRM